MCAACGIVERLTTVQRLAIPSLLVRRDVLVKSPTGTGKTLAYAIPLIHDLQVDRSRTLMTEPNWVEMPTSLILCEAALGVLRAV